jgi:hypothetical protein
MKQFARAWAWLIAWAEPYDYEDDDELLASEPVVN